MSYRLLPHTADLRAALDAASLDELYEDGAALVREILVGQSVVRGHEERLIVQFTDDEAETFFRFVRELVYLYDTEAFVPCQARRVPNGTVVTGEHFDPGRHEPQYQPKAVTRHGFALEHLSSGWRAELVFDL